MQRSILTGGLVATSLLAGGLVAQESIILAGYGRTGGPAVSGESFPISRHVDLDGDGFLSEGTDELFPFLYTSFNTRNSTGSFISDMDWVQEGDQLAFYIADSGDGRITRGVDTDNDGLLGQGEVTEFFDFQSAFSPDGIAVYRDQNAANPQTIIYVAQDDSGSPLGQGIHRLVDLNGDGDATDAGEQTLFVGGSNLSVNGVNGAVALTSHFWEQVHTLQDGTVIAFARASSGASTANRAEECCWYAFTDNNGTASASVLFKPSQVMTPTDPAYTAGAAYVPAHPEFDVGGRFPQWDVIVSNATASKWWNNVEYFAKAPTNTMGPNEYYFGASYNSGFVFTNPGGTNVHGLFYKWTDLDGDFRVGTNEITLFANFSNSLNPIDGVPSFTYTIAGNTVSDLYDRTFGMDYADGSLCLNWGLTAPAAKHAFAMEDLNGNGFIETGEARSLWEHQGTGSGSHVWSASFGPFVKDWVSFDTGLMPGPFPTGLAPYGQGCASPVNGFAPVSSARGGLPTLGNSNFALEVQRAPVGTQNYVFFGAGQTSVPLPTSVAPAGCNLQLQLIVGGFGPVTAGANGIASFPLPLPTDPSLMGVTFETQWATFVFGAATLRLSNGLSITLQ